MTEQSENNRNNIDDIPCRETSDSTVLSKAPLVSVVVITYNHGPYIAQAIEGVLMQKTHFPFELVIGEDCSTDGTHEIVFDYQEEHPDIIRVITSDKNVGAIKNNKRVTKACRGKYLAYCDGDDYWHYPQKLQRQVEFLEAHSTCGLVHTDYNVLYDDAGILAGNMHRRLKTDLKGNCFDKYWNMVGYRLAIKTVTVCFRAEYTKSFVPIERAAEEENWKQGDFQRFLYIARHSEIGYLPEATAVYRARATGSATSPDGHDSNKAIEFTASLLSARKFMMNYLDLDFDRYKQPLVNDCRKIVLLAFKSNNLAKFSEYYSELLDFSAVRLLERLMHSACCSNIRFYKECVLYVIKVYCFLEILVRYCRTPSWLFRRVIMKVKGFFIRPRQ